MLIQCDISRLLRRYHAQLNHTGIDRVNLDYAKWIIRTGGSVCIQRGHRLEAIPKSLGQKILLGTHFGKEASSHSTKRNRLDSLRKLLSDINFVARKEVSPACTIFNTSHAWLERQDVWDWLQVRKNRVVTFIHDLIPIQFPEYARPVDKERHAIKMTNAIRFSKGIVVNSRCTESALTQFAENLKLALPPIQVAPLGHNLPLPKADIRWKSDKPYFLFLGTIEPRKNHLLILTVWRELAKRLGPSTPKLIIVGRRGWECEQIIDLLERCEAIRPHVEELNMASDETVASLLKGARALLLPSFAEGFGMPVQEALAAGTPVIASPLPAFLEIAGGIPEYVQPYDGAKWLELIIEYSTNHSVRRQEQLDRIADFSESTWKSHFSLIEDFFKEI